MPNAAVIFFSHRAETYDPERTPTTLTKGYAEIVARRIAAAIEAPTFQVIPERDYSRDYASCMAQAKRDKEEGVFPEPDRFQVRRPGLPELVRKLPHAHVHLPVAP